MKILFIGDYSNLNATLARELRKMGHQADILSDGCEHMNVHADFFIKREKGLIGSFKYLYKIFETLPRLKDYDVVQLINTNFLHLRPAKLKYLFDRLKEQNNSVFLTLAGNDYYYAKACYDAKLFRFSEFKVGDNFTEGHKEKPGHLYGWMSHQNKYLAEHIYSNIDGAMSVLPEYDMAGRPILGAKLKYTNLPIDLNEIPQETVSFKDNKVKIFVGIRTGAQTFKGTRQLEKIALDIEKEMPDKVKAEIVRDLPLKEYLSRMACSDIVLDQLYAYSPAMNALYAMALGKVAGTGAQPEYYEYIGNPMERPLFSLSPIENDIKDRLIELINDRDKIIFQGEQGRTIVKNQNDSRIVATRFLDHWTSL